MAGWTRLDTAGALLGFGLGGFFDGILLHQILQWHHLLSLVPGVGDLRAQVLADGLFHALMYAIAGAGLALLWRARGALAAAGAGRALVGSALIGFGGWHMLDGVLSHWLLGIHRIRLDSPNPLAWDIGWFVAFGLAPALLGVAVQRGGRGGGGRAAALGLFLAAAIGAPWAARPPADARRAVVLFRPGLSDGQALAAIVASGARPLWRSRGLWAVAWDAGPRIGRLHAGGALVVGTSPLVAGCLAFSI